VTQGQRLYRRAEVADNAQPVKPVTYSVIKVETRVALQCAAAGPR
jgi:hypothetical protein